MKATQVAIAEAALRRGARKRLDQIEEIRDAHAMAAGGIGHAEIAGILMITQERVRGILRGGDFAKTGPEEVILRAAVDGSDREALVQELSEMEYTFGQYDPTGGDGYLSGTWDEVQDACRRGLLTEEEYDAVVSAVVID